MRKRKRRKAKVKKSASEGKRAKKLMIGSEGTPPSHSSNPPDLALLGSSNGRSGDTKDTKLQSEFREKVTLEALKGNLTAFPVPVYHVERIVGRRLPSYSVRIRDVSCRIKG